MDVLTASGRSGCRAQTDFEVAIIVIVLGVFFLLLLCFYIVYSGPVSTVLCHITVFVDTCQCNNSCHGAPAVWAK